MAHVSPSFFLDVVPIELRPGATSHSSGESGAGDEIESVANVSIHTANTLW